MKKYPEDYRYLYTDYWRRKINDALSKCVFWDYDNVVLYLHYKDVTNELDQQDINQIIAEVNTTNMRRLIGYTVTVNGEMKYEKKLQKEIITWRGV